MRFLFLLMYILPLFSSGQKYALIDKNGKLPLIYTDSISVSQVKQGFFPIENRSIDTFIANVRYLKSILIMRQRAKMEQFELKAASTVFQVSRVPFAYGDRFHTRLETTANSIKAYFTLIDPAISNSKSLSRLEKFEKYLKSELSLFKEPNEITPRLYNVIVISDR